MAFIRPLSYYEKRFSPKQFEAWVHFKMGKTLVLPVGRRGGKSDLFADILIEDVEETGYPSLFIAKTRIQAREIIWDKFKQRLRNEQGWKLNDSKIEACYKGGPVVRVKGADKDMDTLAGLGYRVIVCDEFALWRNPDIVKKILVPMLGDYNGQIIYGSTKRGKNHFHTLHQLAIVNPKKYFCSEWTIFENPYISKEGREIVLSEYTGSEDPLYRQEILNEYVSFEGMAFALPELSYIARRWDSADLDFSYHWRGMDHGYSPDPTAMVWLAYNRKFDYFLIYSEYAETKLLISQHAECVRDQEPYKVIDTYSDIDPQLIAEYEAVGLALTPAKKADQKARILRMVNAMRIGKLKIASNCTKLLKQIASYEWDQEGGDDLVDAAQYVYNNLILPPQNDKKKDTLPKHVYKPNDTNQNQSFGDESVSNNIKYEDHDYYD